MDKKFRYPCVLLKHFETGKYHPVPFRRYPFPGQKELSGNIGRYKSIGHLPDGLESLEAALEYMKNYEEATMDFSTGEIFEWDGTTENAAMVKMFEKSDDDYNPFW
jgi:hypothetical protein